MDPSVTARETTLDLQNILEQQLSIEERLHTELDVIKFVDRICESLEAAGYALPEEFSIGELLKAIDEEVLVDGTVLDEDAFAGEKKKSFLGRAVGAVKGAVSRGVTSIDTKLRRYHGAKANAAMDTATDPNVSAKDSNKAAKQFTKHYVKQQAANKRLNPESHADLSKGKEAEFGIKHGSATDAAHQMYHARKMAWLLPAKKALQPAQQKAKATFHSANTQKTSSAGGLTRSEQPTIQTQQDTGVSKKPAPNVKNASTEAGTGVLKIKPKNP